VASLVLIVRLWHQRVAFPGRKPPDLSQQPSPVTVSDLQFGRLSSRPHVQAIKAQKSEVRRLTQSGLSSTEIARRTGLSKGEVELIQKFMSESPT
jgi:hypothetical protein